MLPRFKPVGSHTRLSRGCSGWLVGCEGGLLVWFGLVWVVFWQDFFFFFKGTNLKLENRWSYQHRISIPSRFRTFLTPR